MLLLDYLRYLTPRRLGKLVYGILISVLLGEVGLAWFTPMTEVMHKELVQVDPHLAFRMVANFRASMQTDSVEVTTNSWGLRDREYGPKPTGGLRLLLLGDSVVFGLGVPVEEALSRQLERLLRQRMERPVEVINAGVPGYGSIQAQRLFAEKIETVQPDIAILAVSVINDISDNMKFVKRLANPQDRMHHPKEWNRPGGGGQLHQIRAWIRQRSQLYLLMRRYRGGANAAKRLQVHAVTPPARIEAGLQLTEKSLRDFADVAQEHGIRYGVVIVPAQKQVGRQLWHSTLENYQLPMAEYSQEQPNARFVGYAAQQRIPALDLLPFLRAHYREPLYGGDGEHWEAHGHARVAEAIADFLHGERLLP